MKTSTKLRGRVVCLACLGGLAWMAAACAGQPGPAWQDPAQGDTAQLDSGPSGADSLAQDTATPGLDAVTGDGGGPAPDVSAPDAGGPGLDATPAPQDVGGQAPDGGGSGQDAGGAPQDAAEMGQDAGGSGGDVGAGVCKVGDAKACAPGTYCNGLCDGVGVCTSQPANCTTAWAPVCGCDGNTYGNSCQAAAKGVAIQAMGQCKAGGQCASALQCDDGNVCTTDVCDQTLWICLHDPVAAGAPCDDGDKCTVGDGCLPDPGGAGGSCAPGAPSICKSDDKCLTATCDPATGGCKLIPIPGCGSKVCGGKMGLQCDAGWLCEVLMCGADVQGVCVPEPKQPCPKTTPEAQQCGCDGTTYANACLRQLAKVGLKHQGPCLPACASAKDCDDGDPCTTDSCVAGLCAHLKDPTCGQPGCCKDDADCKSGVCAGAAPSKVCKSTGELGKGQCWTDAQCGGGKCVGPGVCPCGAMCIIADKPGTCQGAAGCTVGGAQVCGADQYCSGVCGAAGACIPKPNVCTKEYFPVCGCDGVTYGNTCMAAAAGQAIASQGQCPAGGDKCSVGPVMGPQGKLCAKTEYCQLPKVGMCAGYGQCVALPGGCIALYKPVCGCDDKTYGNSCSAASAGQNVKSEGECGVNK